MTKVLCNWLWFCCLLMVYQAHALQPGTILLSPTHGGDGSSWGLENCDGCHLRNFIHDGLNIREIVRDKGYQTCTGCHGQNGTQARRQCTVCHNSNDLPASPYLSGHEKHNFSAELISGLGDQQCLTCHESADMDGNFELAPDLTVFPDKIGSATPYRNVTDFCLRCHNRDHQQPGFAITEKDFRDPLIAMEDNYQFIDMHGERKGSGNRLYTGLVDNYRYRTLVDCVDCHAMHGTENDKLILDYSPKGTFLLDDANAYSAKVRDGNYAQFCVLCHRMREIVEEGALDTGNGLSGVHETATDCRLCHTHGQAVQTGL